MDEPSWIRDPSNPGFERYHDGTNWTERTRVAQGGGRSPSGSAPLAGSGARSGSGARGVVLVVGIAVLAVVAALVWFAVSGARNLTDQFADVTTNDPAAANTAAIATDVQNLRIAVETAAVDTGGHLPTVTFSGGTYQVTDSSSITQTLPAGDGVTAAGITGSADDDYCVWVMSANGITMHATHSDAPQEGGC